MTKMKWRSEKWERRIVHVLVLWSVCMEYLCSIWMQMYEQESRKWRISEFTQSLACVSGMSGSISYHSSSYVRERNGCCNNSRAVALFNGSRTKHRLRKSSHSGETKCGMGGSSVDEAILKMQVISAYGGFPVSISSTVHPSDQMSLRRPTFFCCRMTSGAM